MQIVINIPLEDYNELIKSGDKTINLGLYLDLGKAVKNGVLLPKGHGNLIDTDELEPDTEWNDYEDGYISYSRNQIKCANVIVEADAESEEKYEDR